MTRNTLAELAREYERRERAAGGLAGGADPEMIFAEMAEDHALSAAEIAEVVRASWVGLGAC
ncbi:hypothetical protein JMM63_04505 [Rhodovulum sulfidophilum]|uniref:Uncharacterized protein n=1 Tax=Rhodovulum sulfidophilum TaxID=35806 RepID=A0ABS1RRS1_RHOSU|nr:MULTISPECIES: hypothetical protein [Rhodovulum]ANB32763.1 hypothetical protein A6W98_00930 [Rhodovulum sulfidophilum DSM 1374]ANB36612.1 hypothetical protein A6024_00915 [Rhodovulum sulfidophilum]ARC90363.1 hypothetical protein B5V46_18045 [Rhodovulum sp. MB263]MBK5922216.1 hypothetical protein [Rhodovulum sulfidophilum]MBL3552674.1 hypothetical protein [Rhodovulum sulfidophilum]